MMESTKDRKKAYAKEPLRSVLAAIASAIVTFALTFFTTNATTENTIVTEMSEYFSAVDKSMSFKQALATVYEGNQELQNQVQQLQQTNGQLNTQVEAAPEIAFFSPSLVQDGLEIAGNQQDGVAMINGRTYISVEAVDPFLNGTITFDQEQNILAAGDTETAAVTKENLLDTKVLYDGERYSIIPNDSMEVLTVAGNEYREGILLDENQYSDCYGLLNLKNDYSTLQLEIGRLDGSKKVDAELEVYLDEELSTTYSISADTPIQTIEIPLNYTNSMKLRIVADDNVKYCIVNPVLIK